ncbi:MAG: WD40/YVTN/BNR-like repeat-containing protein [Gemmatimonadales bacterium]
MMRSLIVVALGLARPAGMVAQNGPRLEVQTSGTTARLQAVSVVNDLVVWASGVRGTVLRTTDGGASWEARVVPGADSLEFRDIHAFDADRAVVLAAGPGDRSRVYQTANGGASWLLTFTNREPKAFFDCFDFHGEVGVAFSDAVGDAFPLIRTADGGRTWTSYSPARAAAVRPIPGEGALAASGTCVVMRSDLSVWVGTAVGGRVLRFGVDNSYAVGTPIYNAAPASGIASLAFAGDRLGMAGGGDLGAPDAYLDNVVVTIDGGRSWALAGRPAFPGAVYGLAYVPLQPQTVVAVGPKGAAWTEDHGETWALLDGGNYWGIGFSSTGIGWLTGPAGKIVKVVF